ncbi:hypothetical protein RI367_006038 [Sorochytrium milnesiophthora]
MTTTPRPLSASIDELNADRMLETDHRAEWVLVQTKARESEYTDYVPCSVFIGTWNLGGQLPDQNLAGWLLANGQQSLPDVFVLGFQEVDNSKEAYLYYDPSREEQLMRDITTAFGADLTGRYQRVASRQLIGMLIIVLVKDTWREHVRFVQVGSVGCGIMGLMGNKGAVAVRLGLRDSVLCFVNSHLAADMAQLERRNQDFHEIVRRLRFGPYISTAAGEGSAGSPAPSADDLSRRPNGEVDVMSADVVFWLGDLNYRIAAPDGEVRVLINDGNQDELLFRDQLKAVMTSKKAFAGFQELRIDFRPTYKFDIGTSTYDTSEKRRVPAWCDRILWRAEDQRVEGKTYHSHEQFVSSDHKPVSGTFALQVKVIDPARYRQVHDDVNKQLDKMENDLLPEVSLSTNSLTFGTVKFLKRQTVTVDICNVGKVVSTFSFLSKGATGRVAEPWLWISPQRGSIPPGQTHTIVFAIDIDSQCAAELNKSPSGDLTDIVILELENGRHFFITVDAVYAATCFARTLEELVSSAGPAPVLPPVVQSRSFTRLSFDPIPASPVRSALDPDAAQSIADTVAGLVLDDNAEEVVAETAQQADHMSVPQELWRLCDIIIQQAFEQPHQGLNPFSTDGVDVDPSLVEHIVECLDTNAEFTSSRFDLTAHKEVEMEEAKATTTSPALCAVGHALLLFLECLPVPIVPYDQQAELLAALGNKMDLCTIIGGLPPVHRCSFNYLLAMMQSLIQTQTTEQDRAAYVNMLADVFGPLVARIPASALADQSSTSGLRRKAIPASPPSKRALATAESAVALPPLPTASQKRPAQPPPLPPRPGSRQPSKSPSGKQSPPGEVTTLSRNNADDPKNRQLPTGVNSKRGGKNEVGRRVELIRQLLDNSDL